MYRCRYFQNSDWFSQDVDALRAADARFTELFDMWTADSKPSAVVPLSQSQAKKWIDIMDGAPIGHGNTMVADVSKVHPSRLMPRLPKSEGRPIPSLGYPREGRLA